MRKTLRRLGITAVACGLGVTTVAAGQAAHAAPAKPDQSQAIAWAKQSLAAQPAMAKTSSGDAYQVKRVIIDPDGASHVRFDRTYRGMPVLGGDFVVHNAATGAFTGMSIAQDKPVSVVSAAKMSAATAKSSATKFFDGKVTGAGQSRLVVAAVEAGASRLAYETVVTGFEPDGQTPSKLHVVTDASTGALLYKTDEVMDGTGTGVNVGSVSFSTTGSAGSYQLTDSTHGNGYTCDLNQGTSSCARMTDADDVWGNGQASNRQSAAVDAHFGAAKTFDYYKNVHGRNGIFGDGRGVPSRVHYGNAYVNAFWDGSQMTYGDGANNANPLTAIDVAGHEMSHGVTQALAGLCYTTADCGGLNEGTSDIFGTMVEFYANLPADKPDYDIGEKINIFGNGKPLRYMYNPQLDGRSYNCWLSGRRVDPHYSSGIANHFFFLLAEGSGNTAYGNSPTCNNSTVTGIGRDKAAKIWYKALDEGFVSNTTYPNARTETLRAASSLYGSTSAEYKAVAAAWSAVSVN
ncbi:M4 family metallopeptidase [Fodinicola acaciae]|uniref:M4 family metallopeptidase n=1 Tax=Fodinicola acaciae TaxID=2681555 RepID=UPI0013D5B267|nr:M4 family metallopeptidase [Fodinicola acaciae]